MATIQDITPLAVTSTFDGRSVTLQHFTYDQAVFRGGPSAEYVVNVAGDKEHPPSAHGFFDQDSAVQFITSLGTVSVASPAPNNPDNVDVRQGLGIPAAMISWH